MKHRSVFSLRGLRRKIKHSARMLYYAFIHHDTPIWIKAVTIGLIVYCIAPIDIVPDRLLLFGVIDDVAIVLFVVNKLIQNIPQKVKDEIDGKIILADKKK